MARDDRFPTLLPLSRVPGEITFDSEHSGVGSTVAAHASVESNALLPAVIQSLSIALVVVDEDFRVVVANPPALSALGAGQGSLIGSALTRFLSIGRLEHARDHLKLHSGPFKYSERIAQAGHERKLEISVRLLAAPSGQYLCLSLTEAVPQNSPIDSSTSVEANAAYFERAHQLEALRHVTSTFAHDFNNLLSVVMASLEAAVRRLKKSESPLEDIERALVATERNVRLTAQILEYAKREETKPELLAPSRQIVALRGLIERLLGGEIELKILVHSRDDVCISTSELETAVLNLVINSRNAIADRGTIEITIATRAVPEKEAPTLQVRAGDYVVVGVRDDGCGMNQDVRHRAVEPLFSTKPRVRGTGLGLSSVSGIMCNARGCLHIASSGPRGTLVELYFPVAVKS